RSRPRRRAPRVAWSPTTCSSGPRRSRSRRSSCSPRRPCRPDAGRLALRVLAAVLAAQEALDLAGQIVARRQLLGLDVARRRLEPRDRLAQHRVAGDGRVVAAVLLALLGEQ